LIEGLSLKLFVLVPDMNQADVSVTTMQQAKDKNPCILIFMTTLSVPCFNTSKSVATSLLFKLGWVEVNGTDEILPDTVFTSNMVGEKIADVSGFALQSLIQSSLLKRLPWGSMKFGAFFAVAEVSIALLQSLLAHLDKYRV
jgi:hypothetical protein